MPPLSRTELLTTAQSFCAAFATDSSIDEILSHLSPNILIHEHGLPHLAPFLGRKFTGLDGARTYFELIGNLLEIQDMEFVEFLVDETEEKVVARGQAEFVWKETECGWTETFIYVLVFEGSKVKRYEIWGDSGAVWLAARGELGRE